MFARAHSQTPVCILSLNCHKCITEFVTTICYIDDARSDPYVVLWMSGSLVWFIDCITINDRMWSMLPVNTNNQSITGLQSSLERELISKYLVDQGFFLEDLETMSEEDAKNLMSEACRFASLKLAEMESRAHFRQKLTDACQSLK